MSEVPERRNYDAHMARLEQKMDDVLEVLLKRVETLEKSLQSTNERIDDIVRKPMQFAAWSIAAILLAVLSSIGVKVFQLVGHLFEAVKKAW